MFSIGNRDAVSRQLTPFPAECAVRGRRPRVVKQIQMRELSSDAPCASAGPATGGLIFRVICDKKRKHDPGTGIFLRAGPFSTLRLLRARQRRNARRRA